MTGLLYIIAVTQVVFVFVYDFALTQCPHTIGSISFMQTCPKTTEYYWWLESPDSKKFKMWPIKIQDCLSVLYLIENEVAAYAQMLCL